MDLEAGSEPPPTPGGGDKGMESFFSEVALVKGILERIRRSLLKLQVGLRGEVLSRAKGVFESVLKYL